MIRRGVVEAAYHGIGDRRIIMAEMTVSLSHIAISPRTLAHSASMIAFLLDGWDADSHTAGQWTRFDIKDARLMAVTRELESKKQTHLSREKSADFAETNPNDRGK